MNSSIQPLDANHARGQQEELFLTNACGEPAGLVPSSHKFARWFGSSKVTDADGKPLVMYHGSAYHFREFREAGPRAGFFFSSDAGVAARYGGRRAEFEQFENGGKEVEPVLYAVFLSIRRPLNSGGSLRELPRPDGIVQRYVNGEVEAIAFSPDQIWIVGKNGRPFDPDEDFTEPPYETRRLVSDRWICLKVGR